jgi:hypothetical protein
MTDADILTQVNTLTWQPKTSAYELTETKLVSADCLGANAGADLMAKLEALAAGTDLRETTGDPNAPGKPLFELILRQLKGTGINLVDAETFKYVQLFSVTLPGQTDPLITTDQANKILNLAWKATSIAQQVLGRDLTQADIDATRQAQTFAADADSKAITLDQWYNNARSQLMAARSQADGGQIVTVPTLDDLKALFV